jgi:hypothetical protein
MRLAGTGSAGEQNTLDRPSANGVELFATLELCLDKFLGARDDVRVSAEVFEGRSP